MLTAPGFGRDEQEASISHLLSRHGRMAVDLAEALDMGYSNQVTYLVNQIQRLNREYTTYTNPYELSEIL